jgi:penicillin-binding protein 1A
MARAYNAHSAMKSILRWLLAFFVAGVGFTTTLAAMLIGAYYYIEPSLPRPEELRDVKFQVPLRVYSRDGRLMQQFGSPRMPVSYEQIPDVMINALIAAEDDRFFTHSGVDIAAVLRAAFNYIMVAGRERVPGGSTITQQVAREYFLSRDYSPIRKFREQILALQIEREFSKEEILELFFNTTFFGQNSYGVAAAAQTYFGKELHELTLSDAAILAGIPQGPSIHNPVYSPENAASRRAYVLRRMRELGMIDDQAQRAALETPITRERHGLEMQLNAPYVAEMVRLEMRRRFGEAAALTAGLKVTTTLDSRLQTAAQEALRSGIFAYDERHGYRGPVARLELPDDVDPNEAVAALDEEALRDALADYSPLVGLETGIVRRVSETEAEVFLPSSGFETIELAAVQWAAPYIDDNRVGARPRAVSDVLTAGDIVRFKRLEDGTLRLSQLPEVQGAFVALDPSDGAIVALSGGFDYYLDKYNRAVQAKRQPGSAMKPFVYSAALEHGFTVATMVNDAPIAIEDTELETIWRPGNFSGRTYGWISLRYALVHSINLTALRVIQQTGVLNTVRHIQRFGFDDLALPRNATLALGTGSISPLDLAAGYAVFANGGFRVEPYFIDRIEDATGDTLYRARPAIACSDCEEPAEPLTDEEILASIQDVTDLYPRVRKAPRAITPQNAYLMSDMMRDVISAPGGTGNRARRALGRDDIAGKTGTTDDNIDTWFAGFHPKIVAVAWVGFNSSRPLGASEQGAYTAIPIWADFMKEALDGVAPQWPDPPPGIVNVRINPENGLRANGCSRNTVFEMFRVGHVPELEPECRSSSASPRPQGTTDEPVSPPTDKIF